MHKKDSLGLTLGNPGMHSALAVVGTELEEVGKDPGTWAMQWKVVTKLTVIQAFEPASPLARIARVIRDLHAAYQPSDPKRFGRIIIDVQQHDDVAREFKRLLPSSKLGVRAIPIVEEGGAPPAVSRVNLLRRWRIAVEQPTFVVAEGVGEEWREHALNLDSDRRWRQSDDDYLACAIALAVWGARAAPVGERREYIA